MAKVRNYVLVCSVVSFALRSSFRRDLRSEVRAKETVLRDLRRQSSLLTQEKETLKYRLDELSEPADERRRESRRSMTFPKESLRMQLDSVSEQENI